MKRYLIPIQNAEERDTIQRIKVDEPVELYRLRDGTHRVVAERNGKKIPLGPKDRYVSRKKGPVAPVEVSPNYKGIQVSNRESTNPIEIELDTRVESLEKDESLEITEDCVIKLGQDVEVRANVRDVEVSVDEGTSSAAGNNRLTGYVIRTTEAIEYTIQMNNVAECRDYLKEIRDTLIAVPVDHPGYERAKENVENKVDQLDSKLNSDMLSNGFDEQKQNEIESVLHTVRTMYEQK